MLVVSFLFLNACYLPVPDESLIEKKKIETWRLVRYKEPARLEEKRKDYCHVLVLTDGLLVTRTGAFFSSH